MHLIQPLAVALRPTLELVKSAKTRVAKAVVADKQCTHWTQASQHQQQFILCDVSDMLVEHAAFTRNITRMIKGTTLEEQELPCKSCTHDELKSSTILVLDVGIDT